MLTRKDFIAIALQLARIENDDARKTATDIQVTMLRTTNPRFDENRFRNYVETKVMRRRLET